jgi:DNA-damage-inducible protein D
MNYEDMIFEKIKHIDDDGVEFWYARELQEILGYKEWRNFNNVIDKAKLACTTSGNVENSHFVDVNKMVESGVADVPVKDIMLTRYACYLIAQNGDPRKKAISLAQTYFAVQTRRQELQDNFEQLNEDQRRIAIRQELKGHNVSLAEAAKNAGVETQRDYAIFQNKGYQGLYGGLGAKEIHERKGLKKSQKILDHMGSTELAANLFRATQTDEKLRRENIQGKENANKTHYEVGKKVRQTIKELGGTMPEDLPTPEKSIQQLESAEKKKRALKEPKKR